MRARGDAETINESAFCCLIGRTALNVSKRLEISYSTRRFTEVGKLLLESLWITIADTGVEKIESTMPKGVVLYKLDRMVGTERTLKNSLVSIIILIYRNVGCTSSKVEGGASTSDGFVHQGRTVAGVHENRFAKNIAHILK